ncbi:MAG: protein kinase [Sandaracinaceae bacterium]
MIDPESGSTADATATVTQTELDAPPEPRPPMLRAGELVAGRYRVLRLLGRGGQGEVYAVADRRQADRPIALKLHRLRRLTRVALDALRSEFALLSTLHHPNLAAVHDFAYVEGEYAFFTQTLVSGTPLDRARLDLTSELGAQLIAQLCRALDYLHSRRIVHGDVKPGNVLVDEDEDRLILLDFGVSRALGASLGTRVVGSPPYMAPEIVTGGMVDGRSDLYALGITLYQLVSGRVPFRGTPAEVMVAHVEREPPDLDGHVPLPLQALIARLLAKDPAARPSRPADVIDSLARIAKTQLAVDTHETLASHVMSARLVGRERELNGLLSRAEVPSAAQAPVLIVGDAGSGKSRLLREVRQRVQLRGQAWLEVQTPRTGGSNLVDIGRALLGPRQIDALDDEERIELARALPELRRPRERIAVPLDPDRARRRRVAILARVLADRFANAPGVMVVDDLHYASDQDVESLGTLISTAREHHARCLFVMASRRSHPELERRIAAEEIRCDELSPAASRALIGSVFGDPTVLEGTELGDRIASAPSYALWLQESLRWALERGAIVRRENRFAKVSSLDARPLTEVLAGRIAELAGDARAVALACAVMGGPASGAEVSAIAGLKPARASIALADLMHRGIVERSAETARRASYEMHDRYADVVLEGAPEAKAKGARRRAGRLLARRDRDDFRGLGRAAAELERAGDRKGAVRAWARAAQLAEVAGRPEEAAGYLHHEIAARAPEDPASPGRAARLFDLAFSFGRDDLVDVALAQLERGAPDDAEVAVRLELSRARLALRRGDAALARSIGEAALERANQLGQRALACELSVFQSQIEYADGKVERSYERALDAADRAHALGRFDLETEAAMQCALVQVRFGDGEASTRDADRAVQAARRGDDPRLLSEAFRMLGNAHFVAARRKSALRSYRRAVKVARSCGGTEAEAKALNNVGICAHATGQVREALAAWRRAIELKERVGAVGSALLTYGSMSGVLNILGELGEARATQDHVVSTERADVRASVALAWGNRGDTEVLSGNLEAALVAYVRGAELYREAGMISLRTHTLAGRVRSLLMRDAPGDRELAGALLDDLKQAREDNAPPEERRRYLTTRALFCDAEGDHRGLLASARRAARILNPDTVYEDVFGSAVEARWVLALALHRLARTAERDRAIESAQELLRRRARALDRPEDQARFLGVHPLHRAVMDRRMSTTPGCTWTIEEIVDPSRISAFPHVGSSPPGAR